MKLPALPSFIGKKKVTNEIFLSLLLYPDAVEAAVWELQGKTSVSIIGAVTQELTSDSWDARISAADKCITTLEELAKTTKIENVVLGFPAPYLTKDGDIIKEAKPSIKKLTKALGLTAIGFVSIYQAIVHKLKKEEGIPPSVILLGFTAGSISVSLYRVGNFVGQVTIPKEGSIAEHLEDALTSFSGNAILPSRILLYGTRHATLETAKRELLKHQWTSRANFIHFPKVELMPGDGAAVAVSHAGSAELTHTIDEVEEPQSFVEEETLVPESETPSIVEEELETTDSDILDDESDEAEIIEETGLLEDEVLEEQTEMTEEIEDESPVEEFSNVVAVDPEALGFAQQSEEEEKEDKFEHVRKKSKGFAFSSLLSTVKNFFNRFSKKKHHENRRESLRDDATNGKFKKILFLLIPVIVVLSVAYIVVESILPKATVTLVTIPKTVNQSQSIIVDETVSDATNNKVPGKKQEQSESGEKTVEATGKKTIGEGAKGTITLINKSTVSKTFKKGTVVTTGGVEFTLDQDVSVASASETFQGITYSSGKASISAKQIGVKGNIAAGKDFVISGISSTLASGRNDQAFTGGTSKDITVVSRADQDSIVKQLTAELIEKAKQNFNSASGEVLIPETIKTTVTDRTFSAEIGEEATEVTGKVTVTISGIAYNASDISSLLKTSVGNQIPDGYEISSEIPRLETSNPKVAKDGSIRLDATISATAIPSLSISTLASQIAGKTKDEAQKMLESITGIGSVSFDINRMFRKETLPSKKENISIVVQN